MTIIEIKQKVAKEFNFRDWQHVLRQSPPIVNYLMNKVLWLTFKKLTRHAGKI